MKLKTGLDLSGALTALITPFNEAGEVDYRSLEKIVEQQCNANVSGIVVGGTTGEAATLSIREQVEVIRCTVDMVSGRTLVIAGAGSNSTNEANALTALSEMSHADAILSVVPYYSKPPQRGMYNHFTEIADNTNLPVILYDVPSRTGAALDVETISSLAEHENIVAIKDASGDINKASSIIRETKDQNFVLISGNDNMTLDLIKEGAVGSISVISNAFPGAVEAMIQNGLSGEWGEATRVNGLLKELDSHLYDEANPIPIKALMSHMGYCDNILRSPLVPLEPALEETLLSVYQQIPAGLKNRIA